jgi:predicted AAA+ superfamily ATPase
MLERAYEIKTLNRLIKRYPVTAIIGARQVGKTTLARNLIKSFKKPVHYFDLENPEDRARLADPMLVLKELKGFVVIDEIQRLPGLFPILRVLADRSPLPCRFLILGSASPELIKESSESLAGRVVYHTLNGFMIDEVDRGKYKQLWLRGGLPRSFLARSHKESHQWRRSFIQTFIERDIPQLGINIRAATLDRFWRMLAHYHGQIWNSSEFARSFGVADTTIRNYLDILTSALVVFQLQPWHENISKRQVKSPKVYIKDSGLLHSLLNLIDFRDLETHPKVGSSWEGFILHQIIRAIGADKSECFFWATHAGAELDLMVVRGRHRLGFEIKRTSAPKVTPSMRSALKDLNLNRLEIIYPGENSFLLDKKIRAIAFENLLSEL